MSTEQIKPGYKRTEVGVIPEEWSSKSVRELGSVVTGGTPATDIRHYWGGQHPWITPTDIDGARDMCESHRMLTDSGLRAIRALPPNTVLVTCIASIGKNAILRKIGGCNQQINALIPNEKHDADYLYYMFEAGKAHLLANAGTTATSIVSKSTFESLEFPIPTRNEQHAIATALSDVDALLTKLDQLIAKKRDLKQATMQQLLTGQTRLPGFSGEWEVKRLGGMLAHLGNGAVYKPAISFGLPVTRIETIAEGAIDFSRIGYAVPTDELKKYKLKKWDILFSHINSIDHIGKVAIYESAETLYHGMNLLLLRPAEAITSRYLFYWLSSTHGRKKSVTMAKQAVSQASINTVELRGIEIPLPSVAEQTAIATVLSDIDAELSTLESRRDKTRALKHGMMQELLTGRIRLV